MDFFQNQPHPETNETACVHLCEDAVALQPAVAGSALLCAGAYLGGLFQLLVVHDADDCAVCRYMGAAIDALVPCGTAFKAPAPIRRISWLLRPERPLLCVLADQVYFVAPDGVVSASFALDVPTASAYFDGVDAWLVTDVAVLPLTEALALADGPAFPIQSRGIRINDARSDVLWETGRTNPGTVGGMLLRHGGRVHYVCGDTFARCALENIDTFICEVSALDAVYTRRYLAIPNGGAACLFQGPGNRVYAAFVGATPHSSVYGRVAILPLDFVEAGFFRPTGALYCDNLPSARIAPCGDIEQIRDSFIYTAPDGYYYLTGTTLREGGSYWTRTNGIALWRSKDLIDFEPLGTVFDYLATPDTWQNNVSHALNTWAPEIIYYNDTFWLTYSTAPGCGLLKSASGKPEGPYLDFGRVVHRGIDSGFYEEDGTLYLVWQNGRIAPLSPDGTVMTKEPVLLLPTDGQEVGYEGAGIIRVQGKYVLYAAEWNGDARIDGTYDMMYSVADSLMGPYCPRRLLVPHGGHGSLFFDREGKLHYSLFGNDRTAAFRHRVGIGQIHVGFGEDGLLTLTV